MKIRRIELQGFKSFADRTVLHFSDGITGIMGPNGCGKSNVVDAIRWVMGEQSAKHLRGQGMQDIIFAGSDSRGPVGFADVSITFENNGDLVPPEYKHFEELQVSRRLHRDGTSEYRLNGAKARLKDVVDLFLGTGIGRNAYSIIEQGRIGLIVTSKAEERRAFIEDAAGVSRYKVRRKQAERRMEATEQNLIRVQDIASELERQLQRLERQAKKAEKYQNLRRELRGLELHAAVHRHLELHALTRYESVRAQGVEAQLASVSENVEAEEQQSDAQLAALNLEDQALRAREASAHELAQSLTVTKKNQEFQVRERTQLQAKRAAAKEEAQTLDQEKQGLDANLEGLQGEWSALLDQESGGSDRLSSLAQALQAQQVSVREAQQKVETQRHTVNDARTRVTQTETLITSLAHELEGLLPRRDRLQGLQTEGLRDQAETERRIAQLRKELEGKRQLRLNLETEGQQRREEVLRLGERISEHKEVHSTLQEERSNKKSRLQSLQDIQKNFEGCQEGVRAVMQADRGQHPFAGSIRALVADCIAADPAYEKAVEALLGERLQAIVLGNEADCVSAIRYLEETASGRSTFLSMDAPASMSESAAQNLPEDLASSGRVLGPLENFVRVEPEFAAMSRSLFSDVLVVRDIDDAFWVRTQHPERFRTIVALDGKLLEGDRILSGGSNVGVSEGLLQQKRETKELTESIATLVGRISVLEEELRRFTQRLKNAERALEESRDSHHQHELMIVSLERELENSDKHLERTRRSLAGYNEELHTIIEKEASSRQRLEEATEKTEALKGLLAQAQAALHDAAGEEQQIREQAQALSEALTVCRVERATNKERAESLKSRIDASERRKREIHARLEMLVLEDSDIEQVICALDGELEAMASQISELEASLTTEREVVRGLRDQLETEKARQQERSNEIRKKRIEYDALREQLHEALLKLREYELATSALRDQMDERYRIDIDHSVPEYHGLPIPSEDDRRHAKDLAHRIESMGAINLTALEEFVNVKSRYDFISGQKKDLEDAVASLRSAIRRMNETCEARYLDAFEVINNKFKDVFPRLFRGGHAFLKMTDESNPLESGIEIIAQPPGKRPSTVGLLSGGEKALTAVSLIFSIFLVKPTPFCLLDEVDAPLDETNVGRYNELVKEMSKVSQFILITHNKRTMELPEKLYGVTMEEPGISKLVPVDIKGVVAEAPRKVAV
jgi:chromosome segregation protein